MHAAADPLNVDRAVLKLQQLCVVNVLIDLQCSLQRKLCLVDVFKLATSLNSADEKVFTVLLAPLSRNSLWCHKGYCRLSGWWLHATDKTTRSWSSDKASLSAATFLVSCYNITVNPEIEIRSYLKSFFRSFTKCVCVTGVISFHGRKRLKVTFFHLTSKQARLATGSCCISAHRQKSHCVPQRWKKPPHKIKQDHISKNKQ